MVQQELLMSLKYSGGKYVKRFKPLLHKMSDDEEVVNKGNELYKHLITLGYTEFETFNYKGNISGQEKSVSCITSSGSNEHLNDTPSSLNLINLSFEAHKSVLSIVSSKLLFLEDIELLESLIINSSIKNFWPMNNQIMVGILSLSLASWAIYFKIGKFIQLPFYLTGFSSLICLWYCRQVYVEKKEEHLLNTHIQSLKQLCICIHKSFRFLKETEILVTGQVSSQNVNSAMYVKTANSSKDLKELSSWKTLPQLRKSLIDTLHQTFNILLLSCESYSQFLPFWVKIERRFNQNNCFQEKLESFDESNASDTVSNISIRNLQSLIELYLDIQSEYLKIVACCLFPQHLCELGLLQHFKQKYHSRRLKKDLFKILSTAQSKIIQIFIQFKLEQNIHNKFSRSMAGFESLPTKPDYNIANDFQVKLHSIFLLLELMMLRTRNLEDALEDFIGEDQSLEKRATFNESIIKQFTSVRNDFQSTIKEFDDILYHMVPQKLSEIKLLPPKINWEEQSSKKSEPISTGILLGVSDFSINNSDEIFLATAGSNTECGEHIIDDYGTESVAKMPKTLISELSTTLKSIRKEFRARERLALERIGLDGIDNLPSDDEDSCEKICHRKKERIAYNEERNYTESEINLKQENAASSVENKKSIEVSTELGVSYYQSPVRVLDDPSSIPLTLTNNTSFANLVAMKSKMWGNKSEECFTDE